VAKAGHAGKKVSFYGDRRRVVIHLDRGGSFMLLREGERWVLRELELVVEERGDEVAVVGRLGRVVGYFDGGLAVALGDALERLGLSRRWARRAAMRFVARLKSPFFSP